jgi:hypothetical protein
MERIDILKRIGKEGYGKLAECPFTVDAAGQPWFCGTNGRILLAFKGTHPEARPVDDAERRTAIVGFIESALKAEGAAPLAQLREWVGPPQYDSEEDCYKCDGTGSKCSCGECECDECDGDGKNYVYAPSRPVRIGEHGINANQLAKLLLDLPGETVAIRAVGNVEDDPIYLRSEEWVAVVMPYRLDRHSGDTSNIPTWSAA